MGLDNDDIKQLIAILQKGLVVEDKSEKQTKSTKKTLKNKRRQSYEEHTNQFLDMPERNLHKDDTIIDQKLKKFPPTPRGRSATTIDVRCRVCGKEETISSKMLPESKDRYKCNNCSTSGG